jgi:hypothetical protein
MKQNRIKYNFKNDLERIRTISANENIPVITINEKILYFLIKMQNCQTG